MSTGPRWDPDDIDRQFDDIVSGLDSQMDWNTSAEVPPHPAADAAAEQPSDPWVLEPIDDGLLTEADLRRRRHAARRAERRERRADDVAELAAEHARRAAEDATDEEHFVPPEPPPFPRPRVRTVLGMFVMLLALAMAFGPNVLNISPNAVLVLAIALFVGGAAVLVDGLRTRAHEDDDWDDGSRL